MPGTEGAWHLLLDLSLRRGRSRYVPAVPVVSFAQLPTGWAQQSARGGALATSWGYRPSPTGWAVGMPRNGIAVNVFFVGGRPYPPLRLVMPRRTRFVLDGAPDTPEYRIHGRIRGRNVEVWVDIRTPHPTCAELRAAQCAVSELRFS